MSKSLLQARINLQALLPACSRREEVEAAAWQNVRVYGQTICYGFAVDYPVQGRGAFPLPGGRAYAEAYKNAFRHGTLDPAILNRALCDDGLVPIGGLEMKSHVIPGAKMVAAYVSTDGCRFHFLKRVDHADRKQVWWCNPVKRAPEPIDCDGEISVNDIPRRLIGIYAMPTRGIIVGCDTGEKILPLSFGASRASR